MNLQGAILAAALASKVSVSLGGTDTIFRWKSPRKQRKPNGNTHYPFPLTSRRTAATMLIQTLSQIAGGCISKRATIMKQSKQDRSG